MYYLRNCKIQEVPKKEKAKAGNKMLIKIKSEKVEQIFRVRCYTEKQYDDRKGINTD